MVVLVVMYIAVESSFLIYFRLDKTRLDPKSCMVHQLLCRVEKQRK